MTSGVKTEMINGKTRVCGVMGYPVGHSMSPLMHNLYARRTGTDLEYVPFSVEPGRLEAAVRGAFGLNILGLNVTVPHKQEVMKYVCETDEAARAIGAVNTLVRMDSGYKGYNTDAPGLLRAMREQQISIGGETCILLGAGGAAKAAAYILAREGAARVYLLNRSVGRAGELAEYINDLFGRAVMVPMVTDGWREIPETSCLAVQTTSVGMYPDCQDVVIGEPEFYRKLHTAVDVIYTPMETRFMKLAKEAGAKTMNGLSMLLYQGVIAFELWNSGVTVPENVIEEAREQLLDFLEGRAG